jgi:hypothetical protein
MRDLLGMKEGNERGGKNTARNIPEELARRET